jgi:hypothetical protein
MAAAVLASGAVRAQRHETLGHGVLWATDGQTLYWMNPDNGDPHLIGRFTDRCAKVVKFC